MAKIIPNDLVKSMSGKICGHSDTSFSTIKRTGQVYTRKVCVRKDAEPTELQNTTRSNFKKRSLAVKAWIEGNKPTDLNAAKGTREHDGTEAYVNAMKRFKAQYAIASFFAWCSKYLVNEGAIAVPGVNDDAVAEYNQSNASQNNPTPTPPAGGDDDNVV